MNRPRKRDINNTALMHVSDFCVPEEKFLSSETVRMSRDIGPCGDLIFELLQVVHHPNSIDYFFDAGPRRLDSATALRLILLIVKPQLRIPVMAIKSLDARSLMDEFLPHHDFKAAHELSINAPSSVVYECLLRSDFTDLRLGGLLITVRTEKPMQR